MMPFLKKDALIEDLADHEFLQRYTFTREDGSEGSVELRPADADRWETFRDRLRNKNGHLSILTKQAIESAAASQPQMRLSYAEATGWRPGNKTFVLPARVIGANSKKIRGVPESKGSIPHSYLRPKGKPAAWLTLIGSKAAKSSGMMLAISSAFAAPLLRFANEQSFGLCLAGKTGGGKTTATLAASSVFAVGNGDQLLSWNATLAGLEPALRSHNDCLMIVDDLNKMPASTDKEKYLSTKNFAHNLATGSAKRRSPTFDVNSNNGGQYRMISLTSAETTVEQLAAKCGQQRGGDARRLIDVPVYFDGLDHIFDRVPNGSKISSADLQDLFVSIQRACSEHHGHIFTKYIRFLIGSKTTLRNTITKHSRVFRAKVPTAANDIVGADIVRKFGLIYAGGALAIEGVDLPWNRLDLLRAILKCCTASLETLSSEQRTLEAGWRLLKTRLMDLPRGPSIKRAGYDAVDGYVEQQPGRYRCIIRTDKFNRIFDNPLQRRLVTDELARRDWITRSRSRESQGQFVWPDGIRRRSLEINWGRTADA
jgi:Domain of unknown function (DUF927)